MRTPLPAALLLSLTAAMIHTHAWSQAPGSATATTPRARFEANCAGCHGFDGRGRTQAEVGFETPLPDFTDCDFAMREPDGDWHGVISEGGPLRGFDRMMPAFGSALTAEEIDSILLHVRSFCLNPDWPRGELNMPRAMSTEKAYPEDEAVVETTLSTAGADALTFNFIWEQRFGTRNQMEVSLPFTRADLGDAGWASGAGDLGIGVKHVVSHSHENGSIFSIGGEVVLATGDEARGFGKGTTVFEPFLSYGKLIGDASFFQLQAKAELPNASDHDDEAVLSFALGKTFTIGGPYGRAVTPIVEVVGKQEFVSGAPTEWEVVPQVQISLNQRQHILGSAGFRVPANLRDSRDVEFVMYLLWDWFDGGVREGW